MVASADGAVSVDGRSGGLSGPADRMVFTVLRSLADLILVGAGTARAERYRPVQADEIWAGLRPAGAPVPPIAVVTGRLDLDPDSQLLAAAAPGAQTIVITTAAASPDRRAAIARRARVIEAGQDRVDFAAAVRRAARARLRAHPHRRRPDAARPPGRGRPAGRAVPDHEPRAGGRLGEPDPHLTAAVRRPVVPRPRAGRRRLPVQPLPARALNTHQERRQHATARQGR